MRFAARRILMKAHKIHSDHGCCPGGTCNPKHKCTRVGPPYLVTIAPTVDNPVAGQPPGGHCDLRALSAAACLGAHSDEPASHVADRRRCARYVRSHPALFDLTCCRIAHNIVGRPRQSAFHGPNRVECSRLILCLHWPADSEENHLLSSRIADDARHGGAEALSQH